MPAENRIAHIFSTDIPHPLWVATAEKWKRSFQITETKELNQLLISRTVWKSISDDRRQKAP
jgi:hypothetical protein